MVGVKNVIGLMKRFKSKTRKILIIFDVVDCDILIQLFWRKSNQNLKQFRISWCRLFHDQQEAGMYCCGSVRKSVT